MKYKVSDLAGLYGVSSNTIRRYAEEGFLEPEIDKDNSYRWYSEFDIAKTGIIKLYTKCGFSLSDIKKMMNGEHEEIIKVLEGNLEEMDKKLKNMYFLRHWLKDNIQLMKTAERLRNSYEFFNGLHMRYILYSKGTEYYKEKERLKILNDFMFKLPEVELFRLYKLSDINKNEVIPYNGCLIKHNDIERFGLNVKDFENRYIENYPKKPSIVGIIEVSQENYQNKEKYGELLLNYILKMKKYANEHGFEPDGDITEIFVNAFGKTKESLIGMPLKELSESK